MLIQYISTLWFVYGFHISSVNSYKLLHLASMASTKPGDNKTECVDSAIKVVSTKSFRSPSGFNDLHKEMVLMMRNGTTEWRKIERLISIMTDELGGEEAFLKTYIDNYSQHLATSKLNSTVACFIFKNFRLFYKEAKRAIGTKVGESDVFLPMVKDMISSTNLQMKSLNESPGLMFAVGYVMMLALPEEIYREFISSTSVEPEEKFKRKVQIIIPILQNHFSQFTFVNS